MTGAGVVDVGGVSGVGGVVVAVFGLGVVRPSARGNATGGSKAPPKSGAQRAHSGASEVRKPGIDNCGVQRLVMVLFVKGSNLQFDVHKHLLDAFRRCGGMNRGRGKHTDCQNQRSLWLRIPQAD